MIVASATTPVTAASPDVTKEPSEAGPTARDRAPDGMVTSDGEYIPPKPDTHFDSGGMLSGPAGKPAP